MATKWVDQSQPQTLVSATIVMYINAVFGLVFGTFLLFDGLGLLVVVAGPVAAALGVANEKRWGYWLGVALTIVTVLFLLVHFSIGLILNFVFYLALLGLLLHPMSRSYYKTWFK